MTTVTTDEQLDIHASMAPRSGKVREFWAGGVLFVGCFMFLWALFTLLGFEHIPTLTGFLVIPFYLTISITAQWVNDKRQDAAMAAFELEEKIRQEDKQYVPLVDSLSKITGHVFQRPFSQTVDSFLSFMDKLDVEGDRDTSVGRNNPNWTPFDVRLLKNRRRVTTVEMWVSKPSLLESALLEKLEEIAPEISGAIQRRVEEEEIAARKLHKAKRSLQEKEISHDLGQMRRALLGVTKIDIPIDESDQSFLTNCLSSVKLPDWAKLELEKQLAGDRYANLDPGDRTSFFDIQVRFGVWKQALRDQDWETIGGPGSELARSAYANSERERLEKEELEQRLGEEAARQESLRKKAVSLEHFFVDQLTIHRRLLNRQGRYRDLTLETSRSRWLLDRKAPEPQPFGISAKGAELLTAEWLRYLGQNNVNVTRHSGDGGIDVMTDDLCVQVKNYDKSPVSSSEIRDIFGTAVSERRRACVFTSSSLSNDALSFANKNEVIAIQYLVESAELVALNSAGSQFLSDGQYGFSFDQEGITIDPEPGSTW